MYKFTNGLVFYTKEDADKAISAGYKLLEEQMDIEKAINLINKDENRTISKSDTTIKKTARKHKTSIK